MKRNLFLPAIVAAALLIAGTLPEAPADAQYRRDRAIANYKAVARGSKHLSDLSAAELREVAAVERAVQAARDSSRLSARQRCMIANLPRSGEATHLDLHSADLKCSGR